MDANHLRQTKIIFTIGPSSESEAVLEELLLAGVDVCRLNMAHASHDWTRTIIRRVRLVSNKLNRHIPIMMDIKGPEIRTGNIDGSWDLLENETFDLYTNPDALPNDASSIRGVSVNYPGMIHDVHLNDTILVDNGLIQLQVLQKIDSTIRCKVLIPGSIKSKRHINLPGVTINLPALTDKDKDDLAVGIEEGIEYVALSFARKSDDILELKNFLKSKNSSAKVLAKIEDQSAIHNLSSIIEASDGVMVARGDLGIECPFEQIPIIQHDIIKQAINLSKPVIVATHMLESMIAAPVPTRAEVSDVSTAIFQRADCIMLSAETTAGKYPLKCIEVMKRIAHQVESVIPTGHNTNLCLQASRNKMLRSAVVLAQEMGNAAIVLFTRSGNSAQKLSSLRPTRCPIYALTDNPQLFNQMRLLWGIHPFFTEFSKDRNLTIENAFQTLQKEGHLKSGQHVIVLTNTQLGSATTDTIQLRKVQ